MRVSDTIERLLNIVGELLIDTVQSIRLLLLHIIEYAPLVGHVFENISNHFEGNLTLGDKVEYFRSVNYSIFQ